jgi:uncharacterized protein YbjQ (UPF0145 family)
MLLTTTPTIEGKPIQQYIGIVTAETIIGANIFKDILPASVILLAVAAAPMNV